MKPQAGRVFWRDLGALAASRNDRYGKPPLVVVNAPEDMPQYKLSMTGLVTSQASLIDPDTEEMNLPRRVLEDEDRGDMLREDLLFFEDCANVLRFAARDLQGGMLAPILTNTFFSMTHDYVYDEYLAQLDRCDDDEAFVALRGVVHERALKMMLTALDREKLRLGNDGGMLKIQADMRKTALAIYYKKGGREKMRGNESVIERARRLSVGERAALRRSAGQPLSATDGRTLQALFRALPPGTPTYEQGAWFTALCIACLWDVEEARISGSMACMLRPYARLQDTNGMDSRIRSLLDARWDEDGYLAGKLALGANATGKRPAQDA